MSPSRNTSQNFAHCNAAQNFANHKRNEPSSRYLKNTITTLIQRMKQPIGTFVVALLLVADDLVAARQVGPEELVRFVLVDDGCHVREFTLLNSRSTGPDITVGLFLLVNYSI